MNAREWQAVEQAREILQLGERATLGEMKRAYHRLSKHYHPDAADSPEGAGEQMYRLNAAYETLMRYCHSYRFPLRRDQVMAAAEHDLLDPQEWWQARFTDNPFWGGGKKRNR
ncbi:MAG: J domain-containing protein [Desulfobulbus sp.]|jgi:hypothetical protein